MGVSREGRDASVASAGRLSPMVAAQAAREAGMASGNAKAGSMGRVIEYAVTLPSGNGADQFGTAAGQEAAATRFGVGTWDAASATEVALAGKDGTNWYAATLSFTGILLSPGDRILSARLEFSAIPEVVAAAFNAMRLGVAAQKIVSAAIPSNSNKPSGWTLTTAQQQFHASAPDFAFNGYITTPFTLRQYSVDIAAVLQELVDNGGTGAGRVNLCVFKLATGAQTATLYLDDSGAPSPTLNPYPTLWASVVRAI
jgi:hypothetical protein